LIHFQHSSYFQLLVIPYLPYVQLQHQLRFLLNYSVAGMMFVGHCEDNQYCYLHMIRSTQYTVVYSIRLTHLNFHTLLNSEHQSAINCFSITFPLCFSILLHFMHVKHSHYLVTGFVICLLYFSFMMISQSSFLLSVHLPFHHCSYYQHFRLSVLIVLHTCEYLLHSQSTLTLNESSQYPVLQQHLISFEFSHSCYQ
jgi:hypothetical protein